MPHLAGRILPRFSIEGELLEVSRFERGHIHATYLSTWRVPGGERRYLHQEINQQVFRDVEGLMHNIERVTAHLAAKVQGGETGAGFRPLRLVRTRAGNSFLRVEGAAWRTYDYLENTESFDLCTGEEQALETGRAVGRFQSWLADLPVSELRETIPSFFQTPYRYGEFDRALREDRAGRAGSSRHEIDFVDGQREIGGVFEERIRDGSLPLRIVHGDTKLNNILFDRATGKAVCLVDLDTCMPAYSLYDFGDLVRCTAATSLEDERDLERVGVDPVLYAALQRGYVEQAGSFLTPEELQLMPVAARVVTLTIGLRFLTDHLNGDVYFKVAREGQNLDRARVQFRMVEGMEDLPDRGTRPNPN